MNACMRLVVQNFMNNRKRAVILRTLSSAKGTKNLSDISWVKPLGFFTTPWAPFRMTKRGVFG
jgi:hypothetical protein